MRKSTSGGIIAPACFSFLWQEPPSLLGQEMRGGSFLFPSLFWSIFSCFSIIFKDRAQALATKTGRTANHSIQEAIERYLDDMEDVQLAGQRYADLQAGREEAIDEEAFWGGVES